MLVAEDDVTLLTQVGGAKGVEHAIVFEARRDWWGSDCLDLDLVGQRLREGELNKLGIAVRRLKTDPQLSGGSVTLDAIVVDHESAIVRRGFTMAEWSRAEGA